MAMTESLPDHAVPKNELEKTTLILAGVIEALADAYDWTPKQMTMPIGLAIVMFFDGKPDGTESKEWIAGLLRKP
jgi:hypothetical protein